MVKLEIITNNPKLVDWLEEKQLDLQFKFIKGTVKEVVIESRKEIINGMVLVTDPLAGRRVRTTPYLSIILKQGMGQIHPEQILRVEELLDIYYKNIEYLQGLGDNQHLDYQILDQSLVASALDKGMINNTTRRKFNEQYETR